MEFKLESLQCSLQYLALMNLSRHLTVILLVACLGQACSVQPSVERPAGRVIILGFDGVDPSLVDKMLAAGKLPNLAALREQGSYRRLQTTTPPQSPTAWTTFATCLSPGNHGVYDYLARDPRMYQPIPGVCYSLPPVFFPDGGLRSPAKAFAIRKGTPFWQVADSQGARCKVLQVPFAFPPDALQHSLMLCGAGVPEVGGLTTHFCAFSTSFTAEQLAEDLGGGERIPLELHEGKASVEVPGGPDGLDPQQRSRGTVPLSVSADLANRRLTLEFQGRQVTLAEGQWSPWLEWLLPLTGQYAVRAIGLFYVLEVGPEVRFYLRSLQIHPEEPFLNFSTPETYAPELAKRYGLYKTLGWAHDTTALRRDALNEDAFLEEARVQDAWLERLTLDELDAGKGDLLIAVWTSPDRISHVFWRFTDPQHPLYSAEGAAKHGGAIEESYARVDRITGEVAARLHPEDLLLVLSDHGFHSFRKSFNANTWLLENGYLVLREGVAPGAGNELLRNVDWGRTRAYAL
ncbi:MAG: alkaline phosphatase family protein, partial [Candidatus Hydrogenedentes bacterium]|nr:alkaline phosphatase family protein [Candidatus Hydrogenedentota bacterium]